MSTELFESKIAHIDNSTYLKGFLDGFVSGCVSSRNVYFPEYVPDNYLNWQYVEFVYGENQEDVQKIYKPICSGDDSHYCAIEVYHLIENIKNVVDSYFKEDYTKVNLTVDDVSDYLIHLKMVYCLKKELNYFALSLMKLRLNSIENMDKPCHLKESLKEAADIFNKSAGKIYAHYNIDPIILVDSDMLSIRYL